MRIEFNAENHSYTVDGKPVISVTQLLKKHGLSPDYSAVSDTVLNKAADKGTLIHEEITNYVENGDIGFTEELQDFIRLCNENKLYPSGAECKVGNDIVAGTYDLICEDGLKEIKTTSVIHTKSVRWQLSIYTFLEFYGDKPFYEKNKIGVFHLVNGGKYIPLELIPIEEVERLLDCERKSEIYTEKELAVADKDLKELVGIEQVVYELKTQADEAEAKAKALRELFYNKMIEQGVDKFEIENYVRINCVKPTTRESIDTAKLKKLRPEIAKEFLKTSEVKGFLKITLLNYGN